MADEFPTLRIDPSRPGIIRFDDDPTAGILAGIKGAEIVRRCNAFADLQNIARQKTTEELKAEGDDAYDDADFEGAYDALIHIARRAITPST